MPLPLFLEKMQTVRKRTMAELMVKNRDWTALENLIDGEDVSIKNAYLTWKKVQPFLPAGEPVTNISYDNLQNPNSPSTSTQNESLTVTRQLESFNIESPIIDQLPPETTIVFLSETGTGKSTFVNSIVNYLLFETMDEAIAKGVQILIRTCFFHTSDNIESIRIELPPNLVTERAAGKDEENENTETGQSSTQFPRSYVFKFGAPGNEKKITIIDTPGVNDVRGMEVEKKNFHNTLAFLANYRHINAFCILLKPNQSTLTVPFRYCINELLSALHVTAAKNILFCMTNTRGTGYKYGETVPILKVEMNKLKERGVTIPVDQNTVFCFENDCFRHLCELKSGVVFEKHVTDTFRFSWDHSMAETYRMFAQIIKLKPHNMKETLSVNDIRAIILSLSRPLGEIARNQKYNEELINEKLKLIEKLRNEGKSLKDQLYVDQLVLEAEKAKYPITVCAGEKCVEHKTIDDIPGGRMTTIYKTECHKECYLKNVEQKLLDNPDLQKCWALHKNPEKCRVCGCSWKLHLHENYRMVQKPKKVVDQRVQESINKNEELSKTAEIFIQELQEKKENYQREMATISRATIDFASFLKHCSITGYNTAYIDYLDLLIKQESYKTGHGGNNSVVEKLRQYRNDYKQQIDLLECQETNANSAKSLEELYKLIEKLRSLKFYGQILKDVELLEMNSTNYKDDATAVKIKSLPKIFTRIASKTKELSGSKQRRTVS